MMQLQRDHARKFCEESKEEKRVGPFVIKDTILGEGTTGTVKLAFNTCNGEFAAVKIVNKSISRKRKEAKKEIKILQKVRDLDTPLIHLEHVEEDQHNIYIFLKYMEMGDLYSYITKTGTFEEADARRIFRQLLTAVELCHKKLRICHHDIKLENCVIDSKLNLKLIDFGFAVNLDSAAGKDHIQIYDSSPAYSPLEILLKRPHDESVDIFSMGTCLYYMLFGQFPFCDPDKTSLDELTQNLQLNDLQFPPGFSSPLQDLLLRMLAKKKNRITLDALRHHQWINIA
jgi:5'-AMP-activated protein kinase catalytic alpha subunit